MIVKISQSKSEYKLSVLCSIPIELCGRSIWSLFALFKWILHATIKQIYHFKNFNLGPIFALLVTTDQLNLVLVYNLVMANKA